jgi:PAS domain S-box-containing protein
MLYLLQDQLTALRKENVSLRRIVADHIPKQAASILESCTTVESELLSEGPIRADSNPQTCILMEPDYRLIQALVTSQQNFVLSDPTLADNPIVYCSDGFCKLSGYKRSEIIGRNCRFLQGPGTDQAAVNLIRAGVEEGRDMSVCLLNYKANGKPFWNQFFVAAIRDQKGTIVNYVGVQCEVNTPALAQIKARVKRLPVL